MFWAFNTKCNEAEIELVGEILRSGKLVRPWEQVTELEHTLTRTLQRHVAMCASGTDALVLAMEEFANVEIATPEVIIPDFTFSAPYDAARRACISPVICDVDPVSKTPTAEAIARLITPRTVAVVVVHAYGWPAPGIERIAELCERKGIALIEDCAQAFGAMVGGRYVGTFGAAAIFSFYPTKPLSGIGEGGAVAFANAFAAERARMIRNHGWNGLEQVRLGYNSRMDEVNAAVIRARLERYSATALHLSNLAKLYYEGLPKEIEKLPLAPGHEPVPYVFPIFADNRDELRARLARYEIQTLVHYDPPVSRLRMCHDHASGEFPVAAAAASRQLSLPCHRGMTPADVERICRILSNDDGGANEQPASE